MAPIFKSLLAFAAVLPFALAAPTRRSLKIRELHASASEIPGNYIVVFKEGSDLATISSHFSEARSLTKRDGEPVEIKAEYDMDSFKGYAVAADDAAIDAIAAKDEVDYIEPDQMMHTLATVTQSGGPWGLGRISSRTLGSTTYSYDDTAGQGAFVYVVDTGILTTHTQFGGRAVFGASFISGQTGDGQGHGTHCAGTIGGSTYGVAKKVGLVAVKVLDNTGSGANSGVISGMQWVASDAQAKGRTTKSVMSMSLGGGFSSATNSAVRAVYNAGVTVVVAAGNEGQLASNVSPASESTAITVAASGKDDARSIWRGATVASNYGAAVDIFAPGTDVLSCGISSNSATASLSGTSMATPHVAGLAAYLIAKEGLSGPAAVWNRINALATTGVITDVKGSPNKLAYNGIV